MKKLLVILSMMTLLAVACKTAKYTKECTVGNVTVNYTSRVSKEEVKKIGDVLCYKGEDAHKGTLFVDKRKEDNTYEIEAAMVFNQPSDITEEVKELAQEAADRLSESLGGRVVFSIINSKAKVLYTTVSVPRRR